MIASLPAPPDFSVAPLLFIASAVILRIAPSLAARLCLRKGDVLFPRCLDEQGE